jgi:ABC-type sugar transport system permease subunit
MARAAGRSGAIGVIVMVVGVIFAVAGVATYVIVSNELAAENITVSKDAKYFAGQDVTGPFTAYSEAETISKHALQATGGKTYAELDKDDPVRATAMQASFLRASLFTSVVAFGVAALAAVLGVMLVLIGWALRSQARAAVVPDVARRGDSAAAPV